MQQVLASSILNHIISIHPNIFLNRASKFTVRIDGETEREELIIILLFNKKASLGIITWILFVSSGIIIARYYKGLLKNSKPCNLNVWFFLHRPVMIAAVLLSVSSFLIILS